jgi:hypothetical protein
LFLEADTRALHGRHLVDNIRPVIAMLQSSVGRQPHAAVLHKIRDRLLADAELRAIWNEYEISSPLQGNTCTIESPIGTFRYEAMTLPFAKSRGIVVQVPDDDSRRLFADARLRGG